MHIGYLRQSNVAGILRGWMGWHAFQPKRLPPLFIVNYNKNFQTLSNGRTAKKPTGNLHLLPQLGADHIIPMLCYNYNKPLYTLCNNSFGDSVPGGLSNYLQKPCNCHLLPNKYKHGTEHVWTSDLGFSRV